MSYEPDKCLDDLCEIKADIMKGLKAEIAGGLEKVDTEEAYKVVDMIKDLAAAEKDCLESEYYKAVIEAMGQDTVERYGYMPNDNWTYRDTIGYNNRHYGNGKFAPKGSGSYMGFKPTMRQMPYIHDYIEDPEEFSRNMRYGYSDSSNNRYGRSYSQYQDAKRYYTESHSEKDKNEMTMHAKEHLSDTLVTLRDIWSTADPELKKRMKNDLSNLMGEMGT